MTREEAIEVFKTEHPYNPKRKDNDLHTLAKAFDMAISALSENKREWIPVTERLPKDGQSVLFCDIDDDIMVGYHVKGRPVTHFSQDGTYEDMKNVRAWQPLPEPYKAESEG